MFTHDSKCSEKHTKLQPKTNKLYIDTTNTQFVLCDDIIILYPHGTRHKYNMTKTTSRTITTQMINIYP